MGWAAEAAALLAPARRWDHPAQMAEDLTAATRRPFLRPAHVDLISREFAACYRAHNGRLMINLPPRHGKTESTRWGCAWVLHDDPWARIISASYTVDLARDSADAVRGIVREHGEALGVQLRRDSQAVHRWRTPQGGGYLAVGVNGPITGRGADFLVVDDPTKNRAAAESPTWRRRTREWWESDVYTRLEPGASIVVIGTRWHRQDLLGTILESARATGEVWRVVNLPALAHTGDELGRAPGEALWPERYNVEELERIRATVGPYAWASLYDQNPQARSQGAYWSDDDIRAAEALAPEELPTFTELVIAVDPATSDEPGADETGIIALGREGSRDRGRVGVLEDASGRMSPDEWGRAAVEAWYRWRADRIVVEANQGGGMVETVIRSASASLGLPTPPVRRVHARRGKALRAEPVSQQYRNGRVWHWRSMPVLVEQMTGWTPDTTDSPDRLDAMVHGVTDLLGLSESAPGRLGRRA